MLDHQVSSTWDAYHPSAATPWNLRRVVHLHRRAGFAATWSELQRDLKDGPKAAIDRLLARNSRSEGVPKDFATISAMLLDRAAQDGDVNRLKAWWIYRMLLGPDPFGERLTLLWHNHFATNATKVGFAVRRQNEIEREYARAPFGELLMHVVHDPALLVWLDAQANRKGHPNENLGRELMELFTLGVGHYTESDVKEAARALTGWTVVGDAFREDASLHDGGEKIILGHKGRWKGDDLIRILLDQPATAERLAWRICEMLMGEEFLASGSCKRPGTGVITDPARHVHALAVGLGEFGRRVAENGSYGTDHGTAAPLFLAGKHIKAGLAGQTPSLVDLQEGDLKMGIDFRQVYATVLEQWLELPAKSAVGGTFQPLPLFAS